METDRRVGARVSPGTVFVRAMWNTLELELPPRRHAHLRRFFVGLKPLQAVAYASLLRAMARAALEADLVPVRRDARHDPVELIAAALEVCIARWDRERFPDGMSILTDDRFWDDLAARIAAFEILFGLRINVVRWKALVGVLTGAIGGDRAAKTSASAMLVIDRARSRVSAALKATPKHVEALLARIVVVGAAQPWPEVGEGTPNALPLARGIALVHSERFAEALTVFEGILVRVPGHTLALQQAARCCVERGEILQAETYARRAVGRTGRGQGKPTRAVPA